MTVYVHTSAADKNCRFSRESRHRQRNQHNDGTAWTETDTHRLYDARPTRRVELNVGAKYGDLL